MAMTTIEVLVTPAAESDGDSADPFRYGWRHVRRRLPNGRTKLERVPLTLEDVLHPQEDDQVTHSDAHARRCTYLYDVFRARLAADPTAVVLSDVLVRWDVPDLLPHGPDIAVILGVRERRPWRSFDVAAEGVRPALIIEITSLKTAALDRSTKVEEYELADVPLYVIVDTVSRRRQPMVRLVGYTLTPDGYQPLVPNERGWLWLEPVRTWLGLRENEVVCYDEQERPLGDYPMLAAALADEAQARATAERQADAERQARVAAETRLRALEEELRRLRGDQP